MRFLPAVIVDAVLVLIFAVIGRASHDESPAGFLITAWPFLVALIVGHVLAALLPGRPRRPWSVLWGVVVWVVTVAGGMLLRVATGDTAQLAFIIVATLTLGVLLVGWRAVTALVRRGRASRSVTAGPGGEGEDPVDRDAVAPEESSDDPRAL
jgi:drug/metabolite transporter (DMT)-like permease